MSRLTLMLVLPACAFALSGCAAGIAAGAIGAAARSTQGDPNRIYNDEALKLAAAQACRARASQSGDVHIIDLEQRGPRQVIVWGTATSGATGQSFECRYSGRITNFRMRPLAG